MSRKIRRDLTAMIHGLQLFRYGDKHGMISLSVALLLLSVPVSVSAQSGRPDPDQNYRGNPSLLTIFSVLVTFVLIIGFIFLYLLYCLNPRAGAESMGPRPIRYLQSETSAAARGLDASAIEALPVFVYGDVKGLKIGQGTLECAVCLNEFEDNDKLCLLPKCEHVYHTHCISAWLQSHTTCPVCRDDLAASVAKSQNTTQETDALNQTQSEPENPAVQSARGPLVITIDQGKSTRGGSGGMPRFDFRRAYSTGHSLARPQQTGEDTERFTLRLPAEVRKQMIVAGEESLRRGRRLSKFTTNSDRWLFLKASSFRWRSSSTKLAPKAAAVVAGEGTSFQPAKPDDSVSDVARLPV